MLTVAGIPGVVHVPAVAFVPAVYCVPAVAGFPAVSGVLADASVPTNPYFSWVIPYCNVQCDKLDYRTIQRRISEYRFGEF